MMLVGERGQDVWTYRLPGGPLQRRTFDRSTFAFWTPDGSRLVVRSPNEGQGSRLVSIPADGSGKPVILVNAANLPTAITPDGKMMIGAAGPDGRQVWLWPVTGSPLAGDAHENYPNGLMEPPSRKNGFQFSNDGRWVAYASDESGRSEIFVVPYPGPGAKTQVSINGGHTARWSRDGRELFFIEGTRVMAVRVETQPAFRVVSTPAMLFDYPGYLDTAGYDVSRDGQRFVMARNAPIPPGQLQVGQIQVVVNWVDELRRVTASTR
jgi:Tol biopolymer transport system component